MPDLPDPSGPAAIAQDEVDALRAIVEGTAHATGDDFFKSLVTHLATVMGTGYALVAEFAGKLRARTLGYWKPGGIAPDIEWDLVGSPCEDVVQGTLCHYPTGVAERFPADEALVEWGIQSYLGVPLCDSTGNHLGHLAVFDSKPMPSEPRKLLIFRIFAARAAAEMERLRVERTLAESEQRFRDLFEEAPIAYVHEDMESRFISANRTAIRVLGLKPEEVVGTLGLSMVPDTPEAQRRVHEAFKSIGSGTAIGGVVLELRRKDNGKPIFIQWWSRPDPSGKFTRTMFIDITDRILMEQEKARLEAQNLYLREEIKSVHNFDEIVGQSLSLLMVLDKVRKVAPTDASVLITGETGTGKELFARAIHSASSRAEKPLIKVNCAALPTGLVESELFGHEKGAFSGAIARRIGRFELANGGTIFLDEIGEVPLDVQVKLLRVLQEREFERVGGATSIKADVRIIAATNRDLRKSIHEGTFREDLFYRLNVFPVALPPLRDRVEDVPLLVKFLVSRFASRMGRKIDSVGQATMARLTSYRWPGNVRELENILERAVILSSGPTLEIEPEVFTGSTFSSSDADGATPVLGLEDLERQHILAILKQTNWVIEGDQGAAKVLGLHPNTLRSRLKKMGIRREASHERS